MKKALIFVVILFWPLVSYSDGLCIDSLAISDFFIELGEEFIFIGQDFDEAINVTKAIGIFDGPFEIGWNTWSYVFDGMSIASIGGGPKKLLVSIIITDSTIATFRNIRVGDSRSDVEAAYDLVEDEDLYINKLKERITFQQTFYLSEIEPSDTEESFDIFTSKDFLLTFYFNIEDEVEKIVLNYGIPL